MVRANQNKSHRSSKGVRMYRKIKRMTALHDFQQVLAKKAAAISGLKRNKTKIIQATHRLTTNEEQNP